MNISSNLTTSYATYESQELQSSNRSSSPQVISVSSVETDSVEISPEATALAEQAALKFGPGNPSPPIDPFGPSSSNLE